MIEYAGSPDKLGIGGDWACCYNICKIRNKLEEIYKKICMEGVGLERTLREKSRSGLPTKDENVDSA